MISVKEIMTKDPVCIEATDTVSKVRSIMRKYGYRALPVLEEGKLSGIISRGDVLRVTSSKTNIFIKGIMNENIVSASPDDDVISVTRDMTKAGIRQVPVVNGKLLGIISSMDILNAFVTKGYMPSKKMISDIMTKKVVCCEPDEEISKIWDKMYSSGFSGFPVVKNKEVIGMVTRMDILKRGYARISKESGKIRNTTVNRVMRTPAVTVRPTTDIRDAAEMMVRKKIIRLPVVDNSKKIVGIVDIEDILRAYVS